MASDISFFIYFTHANVAHVVFTMYAALLSALKKYSFNPQKNSMM